jgi:hypothetical protein
MRYVLLIYGDEAAWNGMPAEDIEKLGAEEIQAYADYSTWLREQGYFVGGDALHGTEQATTVRLRDGKRSMTDGPFAETKEQLGGYYLIEVPDLDTAIDAAAHCPGAIRGSMEVRPILELPGM